MKLIVGLGNPGAQYKNTLHNVGFQLVDLLAEDLRETQWQQKFKGDLLQGRLGDKPYVLLKPLTYMNISGESVLACKQFYKLELEDILVVSDDIDRSAGTLRYRVSGGHGGHNGLRSIIQQCGGSNFHRIKIGIGRPFSSGNVANYVLSKPSVETRIEIEAALERSVKYLIDFIKEKTIQIKPMDHNSTE
ncbi:aminoacyl-tRNA hydrolase [bacterium]|nr:aminoacyl-tRNA hydrolase [bacterium]